MFENEQHFNYLVEKRHNFFKNKKFFYLFAILIGSLILVKTTFAANINLNGGSNIEYGQGLVQATSCGGTAVSLTLTPGNAFTNSSGSGTQYLKTLRVDNVPTACEGTDFTFSTYNDSSQSANTLLDSQTNPTGLMTIYMSASNNFYPVNSPNLTVTTNSSSSFTISIDTPAGASSSIAKFTTQTTAHNTTSGATWQNASSIPSNSTWNAVAYGLGKFVAVGSSSSYASQAMYSTDGSNWTLTSVAPAYTAQSIAFGNGTFVAVSNVGVMYSTNGTSWSVAAQSFINGSSVVFGSGKFVVSVSSGYYYSTDGNNWTLVNLGSTRAHLAFGLGNFVGLGSAQNVASSADGITWNFTNDSNAQSLYLGPVAYGNGTFVSLVISGVPYALYSTNGGSSWTKFSIGTDNINSIAYGNGNFVGIGWDAVGSVSYGMTSINGTAWSVSSGIPTGNWKSITYGQGKFVIVASTGQVAFS